MLSTMMGAGETKWPPTIYFTVKSTLSLLSTSPVDLPPSPLKPQNNALPSISAIFHLCSFPTPITRLINSLINLSCFLFFPIAVYNIHKHLNYIYVPLNFSCCDLRHVFEGFLFPRSARLNHTCFLLSDLSAFQQAAPSGVCLTPISFFVSLTLVTHSLSRVPPPPGNLPVHAGWFRWLSSVLLPHLDESIENVLFHFAFVSIFISLNLSVAWCPPEVSSLGFHVPTLF